MAVQGVLRSSSKRLWVFVPQSVRDLCCRLSLQAAGTGLTVSGLFLLLSLLSYSASDPSFNTAAGSLPTNWMGRPGAFAADLLIQLLGAGAAIIILPLFTWGWTMVRRGHWLWSSRQTRRRLAACLLAMLAAAATLGAIDMPESWPLAIGLGGVTGDALFSVIGAIAFNLNESELRFVAAASCASICIGALTFGLGITTKTLGQLADLLSLWFFMAREASEKLFILAYERLQSAATGEQPRIEPKPFGAQQRNDPPKNGDPLGALQSAGRETAADQIKGFFTRRRHKAEQRGAVERLNAPSDSNRVVRSKKNSRLGKRETAESQPTLDLEPIEDYELPPLSLLVKPKARDSVAEISDEALEQNARMLEGVLEDFGVRGEIIRVRPGPIVTLYELEPAAGIKSSRVISLADDIARSMSAVSARVAVVPGRNVIGIELPNSKREMVFLRELLSSPEYENTNSELTLALGKNIGGDPVMVDLASMPHLLIAGTTGSGKSVGINTMILSLLYRLSPHQCKLILIDPKMLELSTYDGIPHLLSPVVTDPKKAVVALKWVVREMEDRYKKMSKLGVRNISGYNSRVEEAFETGETVTRTVQTGFNRETGQPIYEHEELLLEPMPFIVVIVDEMADLMMVAGKDIEGAVQRLAQMARAAGIHLVTATQRPSVDVITGTIKANFPTRISFQVTSKVDSRTILGEQGGEQLLGQGDMLYMAGGGRIRRIHGPFVSDNEVEKVVRFLKKQGHPDYLEDVVLEPEGEGIDALGVFGRMGSNESDELYQDALQIVARDGKASTSYIQRRLQIGYNRAARIIERMEEEGIVSAPSHAGKREILIGEHAR